MDGFAARIAERMHYARERGARLRAAIPALARDLKKRGAARVVLIGSLARGDVPNIDIDVELIVWGLGLGDAYEAGCDLSKMVDAKVEVIPFDIVGPRLFRELETDGVDVTEFGGTG